MRRSVAEFLASRLCPDAISVVLTTVPAAGLELLDAGLVWDLRYDDGRLLGEVGLWDLLAAGHLETLQRWIGAGGGRGDVLRRVILGEVIATAELDGVAPYDRALIVIAQHRAGHPVDRAEVAALTALATEDSDRYWIGRLERLLEAPTGPYRSPLTDEPVAPVPADGEPDLYTFVSTGNLAACRAQLDAAIQRALDQGAEHTPPRAWARIARVCRVLTGDDDLAAGYLERARFAEVRDEWIEIFGPRGADRVQREKAAVLTAIERAFDGTPFPGRAHRSLYQAEAADNYAGCDQSRDHTGRWQDLPRQHILECQWALAHLGIHSLPYYLPAIMSFVVREHDQRRDDHGSAWIFESIEYHLWFNLDDPGLAAYARERHSLFTTAQLGAVARFADYYRSRAEDRARWHALARGGRWPTA